MRRTELDRRLRAEASAAAAARLGRAGRARRRIGWPICLLGVGLFVASFVASSTGSPLLPFDQHHMIGQMLGGLLALVGLIWATKTT